jgi:hypothetical protein
VSYTVLDAKLKSLIQVCKETQNYKKLAVTSFVLTSNQVDEIGIKLGIRPRRKESGEKMHEYMAQVNSIFEMNLRIPIFKQNHIISIRESENLFLRNKGEIPFNSVKTMFHIYYELRKLEIPNLHKAINENEVLDAAQVGLFSFLSPAKSRKDKNSSKLKPLILQKIKERELFLKKELNYKLNGQKLETAIYLRMMRNSLNRKVKNKITFQGVLMDNLSYQNSKERLIEYFLLGIIGLFLILSVIIFIEMSYFPLVISNLNTWFIPFVGCLIFLIIIYFKQFRKGE